MKKKLCSITLAVVMALSGVSAAALGTDKASVSALAASKIAAFPGAEGAGKYATGGRGGTIYHVTNLNDSGTGSFRDAVSSGSRIVVFDVGGTIELKSDVSISGNITVAGQTAPGGHGVTFKNYKIGLAGDNIILRYVSSCPGDDAGKENDGLGGSKGSDSIIDHCTIAWANDEQWGLYSNNQRYTTQWTIVGPSNCVSVHTKGVHGFGVMYGGGYHSWHHNLITHNISRNFRGKTGSGYPSDFVNNVLYNWGYQTAYGTHGKINYVGNYLKRGQYTSGNRYIAISSGTAPENYRFYMKDNKLVDTDGTVIIAPGEEWDKGINYGSYSKEDFYTDSPIAITIDGENRSMVGEATDADQAYSDVTSYVGPAINASSRNPIDAYILNDVTTGTGRLLGSKAKSEITDSTVLETIEKYDITCGFDFEYPATVTQAQAGEKYTDTDGDGMPDWWELERGLDPYSNSKSEYNGDYCGQGYTNIEYYLNDLTAESFPEGTVTLSPKVGADVTVDASADGTDSTVVKTLAEAMEYIAKAEADGVSGAKNVYIKNGTYNEDLVIDNDNVIVSLADGATSVNVNNIIINGASASITGINGKEITVNGDEAVLINDSGTGVTLNADTRSYFSGCTINGSIKDTNAQAVFENSTITSSGVIANVTAKAASAYSIEFKDCTLKGTGVAAGSGINAVYGGSAAISGTWFSGCTGVVSGVTADSSATALAETDFLNNNYGPYNFTKGLYGKTADGWNPGGWDTVTPQEGLKALADSITVPSVVSADTAVVTEFESDSAATIKWTSDNNEKFADNTILIGAYGEGAVTIHLTATVSKAGLTDEVRSFTVIVGSSSVNSDGIVTFDECSVGDKPAYFADDAADKDTSAITGYVTDNIDGVKFTDHDKFYVIDQSGATDPNIHNFNWVFGDGVSDAVYEASYDVYLSDISTDGYCEAYIRGSSTVGQTRFVEAGGDYNILAYERIDGKSVGTELVTAGSAWYTVKMVVDASSISSGTAPVVNYYLYNSNGELLKSLKNCGPSAEFTADTADKFEANKLQFRPRRTDSQVKFYVDNLSFTNLTELAEQDADSLSAQTELTLTSGDSLPVYGDHMSSISWITVEGSEDVVNSDGTINYSKFATATVKVKAITSVGDDLQGTAESSIITLSITGTGTGNLEPSDPTFEYTDDFTDWIPQYNYESVVDTADTAAVGGNSTTKIKLSDKAVFKPLDGSIGTGKVTFTADVYRQKDSSNTAGRSFRIYFENAETANSGGKATEAFATTNIIYHIMDVGDKAYSVIADSPSANSAVDTDLGVDISDGVWYRVVVDVDVDAKTATTSVYKHGTDGEYNPSGDFTTPVAEPVTTSLVSKTPTQIKQIRLVRTAASTVYFDNVSLKYSEDTPTPPTPELKYDVNGDGVENTADCNEILQYYLDKTKVSEKFDKEIADINGDGEITAMDASALAQILLNK